MWFFEDADVNMHYHSRLALGAPVTAIARQCLARSHLATFSTGLVKNFLVSLSVPKIKGIQKSPWFIVFSQLAVLGCG